MTQLNDPDGPDSRDTGDLLEVPEDQRDDVDPDPAYNADAGFDVHVVPNGEYAELSTADDSEPLLSQTTDDPMTGDGAPAERLSPHDAEGRAV